ncbi:MAG: sigma-54-dependent Fis family transcriptional regulator, partial [Alphaproteobacteria bacterium]|nr:sigma-54-dependent Fis family transcriptional regulator [Alphaproteobacteria bacterium]
QLVEAFEDRYVRLLLERSDGGVKRAAELAGMNRSYLTKVLRKRGIRGGQED